MIGDLQLVLQTGLTPYLGLGILALAAVLPAQTRTPRGPTSGVQKSNPPEAARRPRLTELHGATLEDPYAWLERRGEEDVQAYLEAENAYTEEVTAPLRELQQTVYEEMVGRLQETDLSVPVRIGNHWYYSRTEEGKQYRIHCRKQHSLENEEEVLLDANELAQNHSYFDLGNLALSPDQRLLAYTVDTDGSELYTLRIKDLESGRLLKDRIEGVGHTIEWGNDGKSLFYVTQDSTRRPYRVHRHLLGESARRDSVVFEEADSMFYVSLGKTRSRRFLLFVSASKVTTELHVLDAEQPQGEARCFLPRQQGVEYYLDHHDQSFFVLTNDGAQNFKLLQAPLDGSHPETWTEVIAHRSDVLLEDVHTFNRYQVVVERRAGLKSLRVRPLDGEEEHSIQLPERVYNLWAAWNPEFDTELFRFTYTSPITPKTVYDYDLRSRQLQLQKQDEVLGGYDPSLYLAERIYARAEDGMAVPVTIVHRRDLQRDGTSPALLYAYGAYGASIDPSFSSNLLSLLDRGLVYAVAHVRGGGVLGRAWHDGGKMLHKRATFTDFIAVAEHLVQQGYTASDRLGIRGGSAGGLLIGAVLNERPELFQAAIAKVPFVDVVNTMLDESIPLTVTEFEEWGNPKVAEYFRYIQSYSPYDNVRAVAYPHLLITAGLNDPRVQYWEPAKWAARLRRRSQGEGLILLKTNMGAGHAGASGRYEALRELAFEYAFLLWTLRVEEEAQQ